MALAKKQRLSKEQEITRLYARGQRRVNLFFRLFFYPNSLPYSRLVFIVSKKVSKKAVERNQIRRRIAAWVSRNESWFRATPADYALFVLPRAATLSRKALYEELKIFFYRLHPAVSKNSVAKP